jgi:WD40 repeat protein
MLAFKPHKGALFQLAFSPDGAAVASCGKRPVLCVTDAITGATRWSHGPAGPRAIGLGVAYSPDGSKISSADWDAAYILDAETGGLLLAVPGRGYAVAFTPDSKAVVAMERRPGVSVFRTNLRSAVAKSMPGVGSFDHCNRFCFSPDGELFAVHGDYDVSISDAKTGRRRGYQHLTNAPNGVGALAFHPDGRLLVYSDGPKLAAYDWAADACVAERRRSSKHIQEAAFTPDGRHLITVSNDETAVVWETATWTEVRSFAWDIGKLKSVSVSPDGMRAACGSDRGRVVIWDLDL